jgi:putative endonuclease
MDKKYITGLIKKDTRQKGTEGETIAEEYLIKKNFHIVIKNFHFGRHGEIDILAKDGETLVFVEVKSRSSYEYGDPLDSITYTKQRSLRRAAEGYLYVNKITGIECRFDVITVDFRKKPPEINHLINAL